MIMDAQVFVKVQSSIKLWGIEPISVDETSTLFTKFEQEHMRVPAGHHGEEGFAHPGH